MHKKWLYRLILSYIPILFAVIFCLMLLFFLTMNQTMKKQSVQAGGVFAEQVMRIVDSTMQNVDTMASKNLQLNEKVAAYFASTGEQPPYAYYQTTEVLLDFMAPLPMIDSVYLYRKSDGKVLMQHFSSELGQFGDRAFIEQAMSSPSAYLWSGIRSLSLFGGEEQTKSVVSLVKKVPYYSGDQGLIVINVRAGSLQGLLQEMNRDGAAALCLADKQGKSFAGPGRLCADGASGSGVAKAESTASVGSAYTGWTLQAGLKQQSLLAYVSAFSWIWFALGLVSIVGGIAAMTYISHRHYRPLEQVLGRIRTFSEHKSSLIQRQKGEDEFAFIDNALESLIEQTNTYERQQAEGIVYRRMHVFKEIMEGARIVTKEGLTGEAAKLGLDGSFDVAAVAVVDLDRYAAFTAQYSARDQALLKFTVRSVFQEIADEEEQPLWSEWLSPSRLALLYRIEGAELTRHKLLQIRSMAERAREWIERNLSFTVTCGIGEPVTEAERLADSYSQAVAAAERKWTAGPNRIYVYDPQWKAAHESGSQDRLLQELAEAAQLFRLGNSSWEAMLVQSFETMAAGGYTKEEIAGFVRLFVSHVRRELQELPQSYQQLLKAETFARVMTAADDFEWLGDVRASLMPPLQAIEQSMNELRMDREQYTVAARVRQHIAERYADPELSLAQLGETFDMNQKTLSRIFKEEIGEKFVDYLARIRIEHAKRLLAETAEPVQRISETVGYMYPMSFIRVFKKATGVTPGDYRKEHGVRTE